MVDKLVL